MFEVRSDGSCHGRYTSCVEAYEAVTIFEEG